MSDMTLVIRLRADGAAEVVGAAKTVEAAVASVGKASATSAQASGAAADHSAAAHARLAQIIAQTSTPIERLKVQLAELERLLPFANTEQQIEALIRASDTLNGALNEQSAGAQVAAAAQARLAQIIAQTQAPAERLTAQLGELEALRPFATTDQQAEALRRAVSSVSEALAEHERVVSGAAAAQARLAQIIAQTSSPMERLQAQLRELEALRPFVQTTDEAMALERALAIVRVGLRDETEEAKAAAAAHAQIAAMMERARSPVELLRQEMANLEALRPFAATGQEVIMLEGALSRARTALVDAEAAADPLAVAAKQDAEAFGALVNRLNPAAVAARNVAEAETLLDKALRGQLPGVRLSADEHAALTRALREQHGTLDQTAEKTKLTSWQIWNLGQQAQDAAVQLVSGQSPFMVLAQQGPQATSAVGGVGRALALLATPITAVIAGGAALVASLVAIGMRVASISAEARELKAALRALNPDLNVTAEGLRAMAFRVGEQRGVGREDAMAAIRAAVSNPDLRDRALLERIAGLSQDISAVNGGGAVQWAQKLSEAFGSGISGIRALDDQLNFLTTTEREQITVMARHADQAGALALATEALERRYGGAVKNMKSEAGNAWDEVKRSWDEMLDHIAKSDLAQSVADVFSKAMKGASWWIVGMPDKMKKAVELANAGSALEIKQQQLEEAVGRGAKGRGVDILRQQVEELQRTYYALAEAAATAAEAEDKAMSPQSSPRPAHRAANDLTPDVEAGVRQTKWLGEQRDAYERMSQAMAGNVTQRTLAVAALNAEREAIDRGLGPRQQEQLVDLRRREAVLQLQVAVDDMNRSATSNAEFGAEALSMPEVAAIVEEELSCLL